MNVTRALEAAALVAGRAPSIHNTQPWRLVLDGQVLEIHAEPSRRLTELDPDGHLMLISCGAALDHARTALAADGWTTSTERPAGSAGGPLARLRITGQGEPDRIARRRLAAVDHRHTDRRPVAAEPVPEETLDAVVAAVAEAGLGCHVLPVDQVIELAVAVERAESFEVSDDGLRAELHRWTGGLRPDGTGVPATAIPGSPPLTTVAARDFGTAGTLPVGTGHDVSARFAVLYGTGDAPVDWLRAGEALSAAWLDAVDRGLSLVPYSAPAEIASTRVLLRRLVSAVGYPYLVVRLGVAPAGPAPEPTPRLAVSEILDVRS